MKEGAPSQLPPSASSAPSASFSVLIIHGIPPPCPSCPIYVSHGLIVVICWVLVLVIVIIIVAPSFVTRGHHHVVPTSSLTCPIHH